MSSSRIGNFHNSIRRLSESGYRLVVVSHEDRVVAYGLSARDVGVTHVARCADGDGPEAVAAAVAALADAVGAGVCSSTN